MQSQSEVNYEAADGVKLMNTQCKPISKTQGLNTSSELPHATEPSHSMYLFYAWGWQKMMHALGIITVLTGSSILVDVFGLRTRFFSHHLQAGDNVSP